MAAMTPHVGIRELRDHLSRYVATAKRGREIVVTERGVPVARLVAYDGGDTLRRLIAEGKVTPPRRRTRKRLPRPVKAEGPVAELVIEQRERRR